MEKGAVLSYAALAGSERGGCSETLLFDPLDEQDQCNGSIERLLYFTLLCFTVISQRILRLLVLHGIIIYSLFPLSNARDDYRLSPFLLPRVEG